LKAEGIEQYGDQQQGAPNTASIWRPGFVSQAGSGVEGVLKPGWRPQKSLKMAKHRHQLFKKALW